jgi:hypothetical protein
MEVDAAPVFQTYEIPPAAVSVAPSPIQTTPSLLAAAEVSATPVVGTGGGITVIVRVVVAVQPLALVTVTV